MERRYHQRKKISVSVYIATSGQPFMRLKARNLSTGGVFIETDPLEFPKEAPVQLFFVLSKQSSSVIRVHRINAIAKHLTFEGVGLKFCGKGADSEAATHNQRFALNQES